MGSVFVYFNSRIAYIVFFGFLSMVFPLCVFSENIDMFVGQVKVLGKVDVTRVAVGNGGIVRAEILRTKELLVIAQKSGSTSLRLWGKHGKQKEYNIRVSKNDPEKRVRMDSMIRIKVKMVQFKKTALSRLGIKWSQVVNGPTFSTAGDFVTNSLYRPRFSGFSNLPLNVKPFSSYFGIASSITSRINLLASDGDALVLSEPVLSCVNGGTAKFISGGEFPIPVVGNNGQTQVEFKEFGVKLAVSPRANSQGEIYTTIKTEVSERDDDNQVLGVPGLTTTKTETIVNVRSGQTIIISGLLKAIGSKKFDRVPGLGRLPFIGGLFRSKDQKDERTELVVFLTPEVVKVSDISKASGAITIKDSFEKRANRLLEIRKDKLKGIDENLQYSIMD